MGPTFPCFSSWLIERYLGISWLCRTISGKLFEPISRLLGLLLCIIVENQGVHLTTPKSKPGHVLFKLFFVVASKLIKNPLFGLALKEKIYFLCIYHASLPQL